MGMGIRRGLLTNERLGRRMGLGDVGRVGPVSLGLETETGHGGWKVGYYS